MHMSYGVVPSRHIVLNTPIRALRTRLPKSYAFVVPSRHLARQTYPNKALYPLCCLLCPWYFSLSPIHFSLSAQKKFVTNFVTHITNFVIRVTNFLTHVTKFVTKTILYERGKNQAEKKNYLLERKNYHGDTRGGHARQTWAMLHVQPVTNDGFRGRTIHSQQFNI